MRYAFILLIPLILGAWSPWDEERAEYTAECAAVYSAASYAIREYPYEPPKGQTQQDVADRFQRTANILRYYAQNSGYEDEMQIKVQAAKESKRVLIDSFQTVDALYQDIQECDKHIEGLLESYNN